MKSVKSVISVALIAIVALVAAQPASAQFKFGIKAGAAINTLKFDSDAFNKDNRAGFTGGVMMEFTVPLIGVGCDASLLYVHRTVNVENTENYNDLTSEQIDALSRDYIDIPINLKYKLSLPGVSNFVKPFVTTGPSFSFLVNKKDVENAVKQKSCDIAWNFGFGVELFSHVQVAASYGIGLSNTLEFVGMNSEGATIEGKNRYWTVTAAYLF